MSVAKKITVDEFQQDPSTVLADVRAGQVIEVVLQGAVVARVEPVREAQEAPEAPERDPMYRKPGAWRGQVWMAEDFNEPLEDFAEYM